MRKSALDFSVVLLICAVAAAVIAIVAGISSLFEESSVEVGVINGNVVDFSGGWANEFGRRFDVGELYNSKDLLSTDEPFYLLKKVENITDGDSLYLHTRNLVVNVYVDSELLYMTAENGAECNVTGFDNYINVNIPIDAEGKNIKLEIYKTNFSVASCIDMIFFGNGGLILKKIASDSLHSLLIGAFGFMLSLGFIILGICTRKKLEKYRCGIFFGIFLLFMSAAVILNTSWSYLFINNALFIESCSRICLTAAMPALLAYIDSFYDVQHYYPLKIAALFASALVPIICIMNMTGIMPYVSSGMIVHIVMLAVGVLAAVELIMFIVKIGKNRGGTSRFYYVCMLIFIGCGCYDIALYYQGINKGDNLFLTRIGLTFLVVSETLSAFFEILDMIKLGIQAGKIGKIAFTDANTGIANFAAFKAKMDDLEMKKVNYPYIGIIQFDVNNLKVINDTKGHEAGDLLIRTAAGIIDQAFGTVGTCYRTGGDEFVAVTTNDHAPLVCEDAIFKFESLIDKFNLNENKPFDLRIAYGVAYFQNDVTPNATLKEIHHIADERMYSKKKELKARYAKTPEEAVIR